MVARNCGVGKNAPPHLWRSGDQVDQLLPIKKRLSLHWQGANLELEVAQDLFSSHQVDRGSKMLLSSLEHLDVPERGSAVDFGCGYGVLGLAWQARHQGWSMRYVDRDALAVAFARHNVGRSIPHLADRASFQHDVMPPSPPERGFDLVLWNVPGKAGAEVLRSLTTVTLDGLGTGGLLALVVVNPLAGELLQAAERPDIAVALNEPGRDHTVLHLRRTSGDVCWRDAFESGDFDRPRTAFSIGDMSWELVPVMGLPEYDSLNHATELAGQAMLNVESASESVRWWIHEPGAGHLAVMARQLWRDANATVSSRDALALLSTRRAVEQARPGTELDLRPVWGIPELVDTGVEANVAMVAIPDQIQMSDITDLTAAIEVCVAPGGVVILHGGSTEIGRMERSIGRQSWWKAGRRSRLRGSAALVARKKSAGSP